jgi:hypothetical protein
MRVIVTTLLINSLKHTNYTHHLSVPLRFYSNTFGTEFQRHNYSSALQKVVAYDKVICHGYCSKSVT